MATATRFAPAAPRSRKSALALPRQFLAARSIVEVALRPLNHLTEQANWHFSESQQGERLAAVLFPIPSRGGLAASSSGYSPKWPIEIWYGEELTQ